MHSAWSDNYSTKSTPDRSRSRRTWRNPMPIVRRSRKYRAIIGRRCEAYAPLTSGYNGLVGGSNPLGPTTQSRASGEFLVWGENRRIRPLSLPEAVLICFRLQMQLLHKKSLICTRIDRSDDV